jgi:hypothetical protein
MFLPFLSTAIIYGFVVFLIIVAVSYKLIELYYKNKDIDFFEKNKREALALIRVLLILGVSSIFVAYFLTRNIGR